MLCEVEQPGAAGIWPTRLCSRTRLIVSLTLLTKHEFKGNINTDFKMLTAKYETKSETRLRAQALHTCRDLTPMKPALPAQVRTQELPLPVPRHWCKRLTY